MPSQRWSLTCPCRLELPPTLHQLSPGPFSGHAPYSGHSLQAWVSGRAEALPKSQILSWPQLCCSPP